MEVINSFWVICLIAFGIFMGVFQVLLMFKLWNMCDNVKSIAIQINKEIKNDKEPHKCVNGNIKIEDVVVRIKDKKQLKVLDIEDGKYLCRPCGVFAGQEWYEMEEIIPWDEFISQKNEETI